MFNRILVVLGGSEGSHTALQRAVELAKLAHTDLHAILPKGRLPAQGASLSEVKVEEERIEAEARRVAEHARVFAELHGVELHVKTPYGDPLKILAHALRKASSISW